MIYHIVMWQFKEEIEEDRKPELKAAMAENLCGLVGQVPGLLSAEFVTHPIPSSTHDMALVTTFVKAEDIAGYSGHPAHQHVANTYVRPFVHNRACLDFEM